MEQFVIFDMDGVLVDSEPLHFELEQRLFAQLGLVVPPHLHESLVGMAPRTMWQTLQAHFALSQPVSELLALERQLKLTALQEQTVTCIPGVDRLLDVLRTAGFRLSVASSSPRALIQLFLDKLGFYPYFDHIVSSDDVREGKPAPDIFLEVAQRYGQPPALFTVVEDSTNGVRAAKAAGMRCIGYQSQQSGQQDLALADLITDDFHQLRPTDFRVSAS
ncbi:HAD family hydrolase [Hymenobacter terrenus]|uniref:HAD family hydrolase n=1 Tax=Hymenobacter terrenus TaxID=1629124 RepID=UPI0006196A27|nr:HAD family phosphatase [Hymenobacter terrenus]